MAINIAGHQTGETTRRYRVAYLVTHPIQYQAPLLRLIARQPDIDLTVFFETDLTVGSFRDPGFGQVIKWDVPLLEGYRYEFLPTIGAADSISRHRPLSYGFFSRLKRARFDALWVHGYARRSNLTAILVARMAGLKIFVRDEANALSAPRSRLRRIFKALFFRFLSRLVDGFLAIGSANRDYYLANGIDPDKIFLMPYAVDNDFFAERAAQTMRNRETFRRELGLEAGRPVILFASKFQARKRPGDLLLAYEQLLKKIPNSKDWPYLLFVGDGELRASLEDKARKLSLTHTRFLGFRNQTELSAFYDLCSVFVLPSTHEPWGLVVNEVMAAGRPVIVGSEVGCVADLVKPGHNGFTVRAGDIDGLADALFQVIGASSDQQESMCRASREIIHDWDFERDVSGLRQALKATFRDDDSLVAGPTNPAQA